MPTAIPISPDNGIASVSLKDAEQNPDSFAQELGRSFEHYGFAIVADHGIPAELIGRAEEKAKAFFALPEQVKSKYFIPGTGGARGYTPFGIETAKGAMAHDLKEFWHVGRDLPDDHPFRDHMPGNVWPAEVTRFKDTFQELYRIFDRTGLKILQAIARYLKIDEGFFADTVRDGNSVMRLLHYPPIEGEPGSHVRAGAHEDINTITLLLGADEAGLELLTKDGRWIPVSPNPGELVVNIGVMLQRLTNGQLRSTSHRVVNPPPERRKRSRYSMPFFLHFRSDFLIEPLPGTVGPGEQPKWPPITADEYLQERLREIKLV